MVLDYVNGGELFSHLKRERRFGEERARLYASQVRRHARPAASGATAMA
jgi:hypothetical protein